MSVISRGMTRLRRGVAAVDTIWLALLTLGLLAVTTLPYLWAYLQCPVEKQFMGILLNVPDTAQYLSWARESGAAVLIENRLTSERGDPAYFNLFWLVVGRLAVALGLGLAETLQIVRLLVGAFLLGAIYWFVSLMVQDRLHRWAGFLLISLGGGLGWLLVLAKQFTGELSFPLDLYVNEANTFLTVLAFPHQAMAAGLLVAILGLSARAFDQNSFRMAALAGFLTILLGVQHGYDLLVVYAVVGTAALLIAHREGGWIRPLLLCMAICGGSLPVAAYLTYLTRESPIWRGVLAQYGNAGVYTPSPVHLLLLMGIPLVVLLIVPRPQPDGGQNAPRELLLRVWLVVGFLLLYIPTDFQIKMLSGWQVPVGIFATRTVLGRLNSGSALVRRAGARRTELVCALLLILSVAPTNVYLFSWRFVDLGRNDYPYYLQRDELSAFRWLEASTQPSDVVLSSLTIGQYIPSMSGNSAFLAHWAQTLDFYGKRQMVNRFFDSTVPDTERVQMVKRFGVRYVFYGDQERALGGFDPDRSHLLTKVFSQGRTSVYRVESEASS